ncbi:MAG: alpha/beta hydrolase family protein [Planctomycetota bacterium]|jgi:hypothetical protein
MGRTIVKGLLAACLAAAGAPSAGAQPFTTVVTHGFTTGAKGLWVQAMAEAIVARAGEGTVYRYDPGDGRWQLVASLNEPDDVVVLIFDWTAESDGPAVGPNWNYVQAAADALHASLRHPRYTGGGGPADVLTGRTVHLIGHSRGACVISETARRLALAGIAVDQVTTLDPHPVDGTLDWPVNFDWGDPTPQKWTGVTWADNYWRADGGFLNAADFDGIPLDNVMDVELDESALECDEAPGTLCMGQPDSLCGYDLSHLDVHLWYHGTIDTSPNPDDGEECISDLMRDTWWIPDGFSEFAYWFSVLGGGSADRTAQPAGVTPGVVPILYNGEFEDGTYAGWLHHGGDGLGTIASDGGGHVLQLTTDAVLLDIDFTHNRFWLPSGACAVVFDYRVDLSSLADDELRVRMRDVDGAIDEQIGTITFSAAGDWVLGHVVPLPGGVPRQQAYLLTFELAAGAALGASVSIDNVRVSTEPGDCGCPWDLDLDGTVGVVDFLQLLSAWGPNPGHPADFDGDGGVGVTDFLALLANWGPC